jgi:hypothetical protein
MPTEPRRRLEEGSFIVVELIRHDLPFFTKISPAITKIPHGGCNEKKRITQNYLHFRLSAVL